RYREEAAAALAARAELGAELEPQVVDAFVERVERQLAQRIKRDLAQRGKSEDERGMSFVVALVSLGCGIPTTAIAAGAEGLPGIAVAWAGIALVNFFARR
ncbi:MAG: hypothetical protein ABR583_12450, partial [Gaiellaceae bacterium]